MLEPMTRPILCPVLIGRDAQLAALVRLLDRARAGHGQIALISGEAQTYHQQYTEILQTLRQPGEICEISDVVVCPAFLNPLGLADEGQSDYWVNQTLANYFGHQQVIRIEQMP